MTQNLNRYDLYERAVQSSEFEARFLHAVHGANPTILREDFAGPAAIARAWIRLRDEHHAVAIDVDDEPLAHAERRAEATLDDVQRARLRCLREDVRSAPHEADIIASLNFALCELDDRAELDAYLRNAATCLAPGRGIIVADLYAGPGAFIPGETDVEITDDQGDAITYTWDQIDADPLTGRVRNAIHFSTDRGDIRNAFTYDWRLWSIPELRDAMQHAGFAATDVYTTYGDAIDDEGNLLVQPATPDDIDPEEDFVAYVVGRI